MKTKNHPWQQVATCKCGWVGQCSHGDLFHLTYQGSHINVCPLCGADKNINMTIVTAREVYVKESWWRPYQFSHREFKK